MTVALRARSAGRTAGRNGGGAPARRAVVRWAWRLFRREWRRQALILTLLVVAVAATTIGLGVASNATVVKADPTFGTANTIINLPGSDRNVALDLAAIRARVGAIDVIEHATVAVPGSIAALDLRAQDPNGVYAKVTLRLDAGRYPTGAHEVAMTSGVATLLGLHVGDTWIEDGTARKVVGLVENPLNLLDQFALVAPGQANPPASIAVLATTGPHSLQSFPLPSGVGTGVDYRGTGSAASNAAIVLVLGTLGLIFVGLMGVAGFTVMAQRRLRALGVLGSIGASDRHIRLVMLANGAAVGATAAVVGTGVGLIGWFAFVPTLQSLSEHRVNRFALPWWAIGADMFLTLATAVVAAWWPARAVARVPVVAALSGRPPRPRPAHRFATVGAVLLATGMVLLGFAHQRRAGYIIGGTVLTSIGLLLLAPLAIRGLAAVCGRWTISVRLAVRDLARYQARSAAALGAITMAVGISATIAISAAAAQSPSVVGNLEANQLMLYSTPAGAGNQVPPVSAAQLHGLSGQINQLATALHADVLALEQAYNPKGGVQPPQPGPGGQQPAGFSTAVLAQVTINPRGEQISSLVTLYVATPAVLARFGIQASQINPATDIISSRHDLGGLQIFSPVLGPAAAGGSPDGAASKAGSAGASPGGPGAPPGTSPRAPTDAGGLVHPTIQTMPQLPASTSDPGTLITSRALKVLDLQAIPSGWLLQTASPLTATQIATARKVAATMGLFIETKTAQKSSATLRTSSTVAGIVLALGVLAMTVGLIRSETAGDLRTLAAAGASSTTRRSLTAATAGALALLGALLGLAGAYAALVAWNHRHLSPLGHVPVLDLTLLLAGLPVIAILGGWLLAGREPRDLGTRPLE